MPQMKTKMTKAATATSVATGARIGRRSRRRLTSQGTRRTANVGRSNQPVSRVVTAAATASPTTAAALTVGLSHHRQNAQEARKNANADGTSVADRCPCASIDGWKAKSASVKAAAVAP